MTIQLGPFQLQQEIGKGAMGVVWQGLHRRQKIPVAIKVLTRNYARAKSFVDAFEDEARATASMQHHAIARVFDYGVIDACAAERSEGVFAEGSPYLVMELASQGTLNNLKYAMNWSVLKDTLLTLLDTLAHAHARSVVHRDVKPANVLVCGHEDLRPGLKLADFGIAYALESDASQSELEKKIRGTPPFMAPEQFQGRWRDYGPWTDLYALGCMAYLFAVGKPPFVASSLTDYYHVHSTQPMPSLGARQKLFPLGFYGWLQRMCAKVPMDRFQYAADAAWALKNLSETLKSVHVVSRLEEGELSQKTAGHANEENVNTGEKDFVGHDADTIIAPMDPAQFMETISPEFAIAPILSSTTGSGVKQKTPECVESPVHSGPACEFAPPFPETWQSSAREAGVQKMIGVGLGLFGLRPVPLVGRTTERNIIWNEFERVHNEKRAQLVMLHGPCGAGKSRLAEWICERAHELGAATVLKAKHTPSPSKASALQLMVAQHLNCIGLDQKGIQRRVARHFDHYGVDDPFERNALATFLNEVSDDVGSATEQEQLTSSKYHATIAQSWALVARFIQRIARDRPVILWFDDVQWEHTSVGFLRHILELPLKSSFPVLMLATVRDEALAERPLEEQQIQRLRQASNSRVLSVDTLSVGEQSELVRAMLGVDEALAHYIQARTGGNPLFCVQLVGDWIERGILELGEKGFQLKAGAQVFLPDEIYDVWLQRLNRFLEQFSDNDKQVLELAAALGDDVAAHEWDALCETANLKYSDELIKALLQKRFAVGNPRRWRWVHGMLRESCERASREHGRWMSFNEACITTLQALYPPNFRRLAERLGVHYLEAGQYELASEYLLRGANECGERGEYFSALYLLGKCEEALGALGADESDFRWGEVAIRRVEFSDGILPAAEIFQLARQVESLARAFSWDSVLAETLLNLGAMSNRGAGEAGNHEDLFFEARTIYEALGQQSGIARALKGLALCANARADFDRAKNLYLQALEIYQACENDFFAAQCMLDLSNVIQRQGKPEEALSWLQRAHNQFEAIGALWGIMWCVYRKANIDYDLADYETAEKGYVRTIELMDSLGMTANNHFPRSRLGLVMLARGNFENARETFEALLCEFQDQNNALYQGIVHLLLLPCLADAGQWDSFESHFDKGQSFLHGRQYYGAHIAECTELAAELAMKRGENERARRVYAFAAEHWTHLDNPARAAAIQEKMNP